MCGWGAVTPFGGVLLLVGWLALAVAGWVVPGPDAFFGELAAC